MYNIVSPNVNYGLLVIMCCRFIIVTNGPLWFVDIDRKFGEAGQGSCGSSLYETSVQFCRDLETTLKK